MGICSKAEYSKQNYESLIQFNNKFYIDYNVYVTLGTLLEVEIEGTGKRNDSLTLLEIKF